VPLHAADISDAISSKSGIARLRFSTARQRTVLDRSFASSPVKIFNTRRSESACWVYTATLGGGLVGGDRVHMTIDVEANARALLCTQASTKVYRSHRQTSQRIVGRVADGAVLAMLPDPVVCFADSRFSQEQQYHLDTHGNLALVDVMTAGRHATGERWVFHSYASRIDIRCAGDRVLYDAVDLSARDGNVAERFDGFDVFATAIVIGPAFVEGAAEVVRGAAELRVRPTTGLVMAAWPIANGGALLRIAGTSVEQVTGELRGRLCFLRHMVGDDPWARKW